MVVNIHSNNKNLMKKKIMKVNYKMILIIIKFKKVQLV